MTIEVSAKKVQDAIDQGLKQLGVKFEDANIKVIDSGGLLRKAKVRLTIEDENEKPQSEPVVESTNATSEPSKDEKNGEEEKPVKTEKSEKVENTEKAVKTKTAKNVKSKPQKQSETVDEPISGSATESVEDKSVEEKTEKAEKHVHTKHTYTPEEIVAIDGVCEFVKKTVELMGFEGITVTHDTENPEVIEINAKEGDDSLIIGRHGETLSALTYIAETCAVAEKHRVGVVVDCNGYRSRRAASLSAMAKRRARECASKQTKIKLETMDRTDRRTVHMALADDKFVDTVSEGKEPFRYVVIVPKKGVRPNANKHGARNERGGKPRSERTSQTTVPQKRVQFDINLHGFVGHNDNAEVENSSDEKSE